MRENKTCEYIKELEEGFLKLRTALFLYAEYDFGVPAPYPENDAAFAHDSSYKLYERIIKGKLNGLCVV